jgi:hypothetical protein
MRGLYRVFSDGKLITEVPNMITEQGRVVVLRYLSGQVGRIGGAVAVGASQTLPARTDTKLYFEYGRGAVDLVAPDFLTNRVIFKAPMPLALSGTIYELGLYPYLAAPLSDFSDMVVTGFDPNVELLSGGTLNSSNYRVGAESYQLAPAANGNSTATLTVNTGFGGYSPEDLFTLAYFINDANTSSIRVRMLTDATNYYSYTFNTPTAPGYYTHDFAKSAFTRTGTADWSNITSVQFTVNAGAGGATAVQFDGLRINDTTPYVDYALVSRAVLGAPLYKLPNQQMDIEYVLEFGI